jgi:hypothetical protein
MYRSTQDRGRLPHATNFKNFRLTDWKMVAKDGVEPPTPAFSELPQIMFVTT